MFGASFQDQQVHILWIVNGISTAFSLMGELFMMYTYFVLPSMRRFSMKLVMSLVVSDFIYSLSNVLTYFSDDIGTCVPEGALRTLGYTLSVVWAVIMLIISYKQIIHYNPNIESIYCSLLILSILVGMIPGAIVFYHQYTDHIMWMGNGLGFCSIEPILYALILVEGPIWFCFLVSIYVTYKIQSALKSKFESLKTKEYKQIYMYPLILAKIGRAHV